MAGPQYRVFLSHSGKDKDFVKELYRRLMRDGVSCFFDIESIGWGANWVRALERAVDECEYIVFVLSPDFCNSEWVEMERTSSMANDPSGLKRKVRPLMLQPCRDLPTFPRFLRQVQSIDVSTTALFEENYPHICKNLDGVPGQDMELVDRTKLPPVRPLPERHRMPYHSLGDKFIGRVDALWKIYDSLHRDSTAILQGTGVLVGTGGLGKSQIAIEYAHRFGAGYTGGVYWVDADRGLTTLITQIGTAAKIEVNPKADEPAQVEQIWRGLNRMFGPCLIVLDNFPEQLPLRPYLPTTGRVHTLVTTRRQDLQYPSVLLQALSVDESVQLMNSGTRHFGKEAAVLAERLGGLPLALELAKSFLNYRKEIGIAELLEEMRTAGEIEALNVFASQYLDHLPSGHELDVVKTFQLSWNVVPEPARQVLRVMGELAPAAVPRSLLRTILNLPDQSALRDSLSESLAELSRLSLIDLDAQLTPAAHRLIQAFVRYRNVMDNSSPFDRCGEVLQAQFRRAADNPGAETSRGLEALVPHAEFLVASNRLTTDHAVNLAGGLGEHHRTLGRYPAARQACATALGISEKTLEQGDSSIARCQSNLALVLQDLGQLDEARDLLRKALASDEKTFEPGHPYIAIGQSNLAAVLRDLGQLNEARDLLRKALASDEKTFEPPHPSIAIRQSNLATVLQDLGRLEEARDLLRKAMASSEKTFEPGHPSIAICQSNLATVLTNLGKLEEARDLLRKALASDEKTFEPRHPSIAISQSNLAMVLRDLGKLEEARDLLRKALAAAEKTFEPGHPYIARRQSNLATVLQDLGELEEARGLLRKALASDEKTFEPGHSSIARRQSNLATVLQDLGELEEAGDLLRKALASDEKTFEPGHSSIATRQSNLALVLQRLGQLEEAHDLLGRAYTASLKWLGPGHPKTKTFKWNLDRLPRL